MFSVGQKVKCVEGNRWLKKGNVYEIRNVDGSLVGLKGVTEHWLVDRFKAFSITDKKKSTPKQSNLLTQVKKLLEENKKLKKENKLLDSLSQEQSDKLLKLKDFLRPSNSLNLYKTLSKK